MLTSLEHLTLEPPTSGGRYESHVALADGPRGLNFADQVQPGYMFPWFILAVPDPRQLSPLPRVLRVPFDCASSDLSRRPSAALGEFQSTARVSPPQPKTDGSHFLQVEVWVARDVSCKNLASTPLTIVPPRGAPTRVANPLVAGVCEFAMVEGKSWVRVVATYREASADRACLFRVSLTSNRAELV